MELKQPDTGTACEVAAPRVRHAAGTDPAKRDQILRGAHDVFSRDGFDATSMADICCAAGVSKSTLYVYFSDKADLFEALVERERERIFGDVARVLEAPGATADKLRAFGIATARAMCSDKVVQAQRIVIGISARKPDLAAKFYDGGANRGKRLLAAFFEAEIARGTLAIDDVALAAAQFQELSSAGLMRPRLFGYMPAPPDEARLEATVASAVAMFLGAYAVPRA